MWDDSYRWTSEMTSPGHAVPRRDPAGMEHLRERIRAIEGTAVRLAEGGCGGGLFTFGAGDIDEHLPWGGLPRGVLHEVIGEDPGAATGFCTALIGRLAAADRATGQDGPVLWCEGRRALDAGEVYGPGLAGFGLAPERIILVRARRDAEVLWAMEEGLRCRALVAVLGEAERVSLTASRRLQLAAAASGVTAFLLRPGRHAASVSAAVTRWRVSPEPAGQEGDREPGLGPMHWRAELFRCRGSTTRTWIMEWRDETGDFAVAAPVRDRPALPQDSSLAG